ncbi:MAG TPA: fatty acid desaturase CarF family protein [Nannocystaceae bacterium]|nr:fatty acid desaturase CarF family protein [Nannocystaceae bacterium]
MAQVHNRSPRFHRNMSRLEAIAMVGFAVAAVWVMARVGYGLVALAPASLWLLALVPIGMAMAALATAAVHYFADNFYDENTPLVGPAFVFRFRQHHEQPGLICTLTFREMNAPGLMLTTPFMIALVFVPIATTPWGLGLGVLGVAFLVSAALTNQIHRWAHAPKNHPIVRWLQRSGIILSPEHHAAHHRAPHDVRFGITNGWLDGLLDRTGAWHRLTELLVAIGARQAPESVMGRSRRPHGSSVNVSQSASLPRSSPRVNHF